MPYRTINHRSQQLKDLLNDDRSISRKRQVKQSKSYVSRKNSRGRMKNSSKEKDKPLINIRTLTEKLSPNRSLASSIPPLNPSQLATYQKPEENSGEY